MDDGFQFGEPAKSWSDQKLRGKASAPSIREPKIGGRSLVGAVVLGVGALLVIGLIVVVMSVMKSGGQSAAAAEVSAIAEVGHAQDTQAQLTLHEVQAEAMQLYAEGTDGMPSYLAADVASLTSMDHQYSYTTGPSTGPTVVSVAVTATDWAAAVRSASGVCAWLHLSGSEVHTGSGTTCTGQAAMAA